MRIKFFILPLIVTLFSTVLIEAAEPRTHCPALHALADPLEKLLVQQCPGNSMTFDGDLLSFSCSTQTFMVHDIWMTGEISKEAHATVGPSFKGFVLDLQCLPVEHEIQADTPQVITHPYWQSYVDQFLFRKTKTKIVMSYSFGSRTSPQLRDSLVDALRKLCAADK